MYGIRITTGPFGTVITCKRCGGVILDEDRPSDRDVEAAVAEHEC